MSAPGGMTWDQASTFPDVYEELYVPAVFGRFADALLDAVAIETATHLLDLASGTGIVARRALERAPGLRVTAVDLNPSMLAVGERAAPGLAIARVQADAGELPFRDASFDAASCQQGLQFFPDRPRALAELRRVLAPGARVAIACWCELGELPTYVAIAGALERVAGPAVSSAATAPCALGSAEGLRALLSEAGFREVRVDRIEREIRYPSTDEMARSHLEGTPVALALAEVDPDTARRAREEVRRAVAGFAVEDGCAFPMRTNLASATR